MRETGFVFKEISRGRVKVRFPRKTACENCNMCLKPRNEMFVEVVVDNVLNAKIGDKISVEMGEKSVLTAALIVYLLPIVLVTAAMFAFKALGEWWQFGAALFMLLAGVAISAAADKKLRKRKGFCPVMTEIIRTEENESKIIEEKEEEDIFENESGPETDTAEKGDALENRKKEN